MTNPIHRIVFSATEIQFWRSKYPYMHTHPSTPERIHRVYAVIISQRIWQKRTVQKRTIWERK